MLSICPFNYNTFILLRSGIKNMDTDTKMKLVMRPPTDEIITVNELRTLFETCDTPRHYIGLEISGFLHLGSLLSTGFKINDMISAGVHCIVFLADWHTVINDKLGGNWDTVSRVSGYYKDAFKVVCPGAEIILGSDLYEQRHTYWSDMIKFTKRMSLKRARRALTIMGRKETDETDLAKFLYPPMQAADIHAMNLDIVHSGTDQRKIHMLVREIFPKMGWKVPVAVHHKLLPGLSAPQKGTVGKMSKSAPDSGIFMHDTDSDIRRKISKAWCPAGMTEQNPLLELASVLVFRDDSSHLTINRPSKFGGDISYTDYDSLVSDFAAKKLHPADLKQGIAQALIDVMGPIRDAIPMDDILADTIKNSV